MPPRTRTVFRSALDLSLPIAAYFVAEDGRFHDCNVFCRRLLGLPEKGSLSEFNISDFYVNLNDRARLIQQAREAERTGSPVRDQVVEFKVKGARVFIQMNCQLHRDPSGLFYGFIGSLVDITAEQRYRTLLGLLSEGVYRCDANNRLTYVNEFTVTLLGYESAVVLRNRPVANLFHSRDLVDTIVAAVKVSGTTAGVWELIRPNGETFHAAIKAVAILASDGSYDGFEGTIRDVTTEQYEKLLYHGPVGLYAVAMTSAEETIQSCNQTFAELFDFDSPESVVGKSVYAIHSELRKFGQFRSDLLKADSEGKPLVGYQVQLRTHKGKKFLAEINARLLRDQRGAIIGRVGAIRDVSQQAALERQIREVAVDIGQLFHSYTSSMMMLELVIREALETFEGMSSRAFGAKTRDDTEQLLDMAVKRVLNSLINVLSMTAGRPAESGEPIDFALITDNFTRYKAKVQHPDLISAFLWGTCDDLLRGISKRPYSWPRELHKRLLADIMILQGVCNLSPLRKAREAILAIDYQVRATRGFITQSVRFDEPLTSKPVTDVIAQAVSNVIEYAHVRGLEIRRRENARATLQVNEQDIVRAVANVLHNAIKYSWEPAKSGARRWVELRSEMNAGTVCIEIEDLGVPIHADEIRDGFVFRLGQRGRFATDRQRIGTGIGLTDAKRIVERHAGRIHLSSRPALTSSNPDDYSQPFLTTVSIYLPAPT